MEVDQVVYEYGKLHLNFVGCQRQNTLLATQLAQVNKNVAALTTDKGKALTRVTQLESALRAANIEIPEAPVDPTPEPAKPEQN